MQENQPNNPLVCGEILPTYCSENCGACEYAPQQQPNGYPCEGGTDYSGCEFCSDYPNNCTTL